MTHVFAAQEAGAELRTSCEVVFVVVDPSTCLLSGCALQKVWSDMECHHPAGEGEDNGDDLLNF